MKKIIYLLMICLTIYSCSSKSDAVKNRYRKVNPHKLHKYPEYKIYYRQWEN